MTDVCHLKDRADTDPTEEFSLHRVLKQAGLQGTGTYLGKGLVFAYTVVLARVLDPTEVGLYFLGIALVEVLAIVSLVGLGPGTVRYVSLYLERDDSASVTGTIYTCLIMAFCVAIAVSLATWIFAEQIATAVDDDALVEVIRVLVYGIPFLVLAQVFVATSRAYNTMIYAVCADDLGLPLSRLLFGIGLFATLDSNLYAACIAHVLSGFFSFALGLGFAQKLSKFLAPKETPVLRFKEILNFSLPMSFSSSINILMRKADTFIIGLFRPSADVGLYNIANRVIFFAEVPFFALRHVFQPLVISLQEKGLNKELGRLLKKTTLLALSITLPLFSLMVFFPNQVLLVFGNEYTAGFLCLSILSGAHLMNASTILPSAVIYMSGRPQLALINTSTSFIVSMVMNLILVPVYGIIGAALSATISFFFLFLLRIVELRHFHGIHPFSVGSFVCLSICVCIFLPASFAAGLSSSFFVQYLTAILCCFAALSAQLYWLTAFQGFDLRRLISV